MPSPELTTIAKHVSTQVRDGQWPTPERRLEVLRSQALRDHLNESGSAVTNCSPEDSIHDDASVGSRMVYRTIIAMNKEGRATELGGYFDWEQVRDTMSQPGVVEPSSDLPRPLWDGSDSLDVLLSRVIQACAMSGVRFSRLELSVDPDAARRYLKFNH